MATARLDSQKPLVLISFLLIEFDKLEHIGQVYDKLGRTSFLDVSSDEDVAQQWAMLGLTEHDRPYLLKFDGGNCSGEMELVFRDFRLVQGGVQLFGAGSQASLFQRLYEAVKVSIRPHVNVVEVSPTHMMFSDNIVNGYLHTLGGASLAFRIADLKWCEAVYGPH
jgi:hypothetical protein